MVELRGIEPLACRCDRSPLKEKKMLVELRGIEPLAS